MSLMGDDSKMFGFDSDAWLRTLARAKAVETLGKLGPYELISEAGRGGQGVVFRARQPGTGREIAIKRLLAGAFASPDASRRFEREVEVASGLNHRGIVTVYGVEVVDGAPLLAMEWIDGVPATKWARGRPRDEVLRLFLLVCDAVQHAHQRGVLHRDLKPSNVLVDASGQPRVLDFGLAKLASESQASITTSGQFLGTPAYAAPEQWRGDDLDARADVYSLGAILFEMLTEHPVIEGQGLDAVARAAARPEPPRPSSVVRNVPRDLDAIVLQALAAQREERYQSVDALSADIRRFLVGEAVLAHSPGAWYVLRKLVARNRAISVLVGALVLATLAYAVTTARQADRLATERDRALAAGKAESLARADAESEKRRAQDARASSDAARAEAERERGRAEAEKANAEAVLEFVAEDFMAAADPTRLGRQPTLLEVLREVTPKVEQRFAANPVVASRVRAMLARAFVALGSYREAEAEMRPALELRRKDPGAPAAEIARDETTLATALMYGGEYREAETLVRSAITRHESGQPPEIAGLSESLSVLGDLLLRTGRMTEALPTQRRLLELATSDEERLSARMNLAVLYNNLGKAEEGVAELEAIYEQVREREGEARFFVALVLNNLGDGYEKSLRFPEAEHAFRGALEITASLLGPDHPDTAACRSRLAFVLALQGGDLAEADDLTRLALEVIRSSAQGLRLADALFIRGVVLVVSGRAEEGEALFKEALSVIERDLGRSHPMWEACAMELQNALLQQGELERANAVFAELARDASVADRARLLNERAGMRRNSGDRDQAATLYEEALDLLAGHPAERACLATTLANYAGLLRELGDTTGAAELELQASELRK
jgi:tetratricopeptide (TPR) repeat protein